MRPRLPAKGRAPALLACALAWLALAVPETAHARRFFRARFEPTSLQLEDPGHLELDLQAGALYGDGQDGSRLVSPDFEVDLGIVKWLELDVDGGFSVIHVNDQSRRTLGEPIWSAAKVTLFQAEDEQTGRNVGVGLQLGPRWRSLHTAPGVGFGALFLFGCGSRRAHVVWNVGTVLDRGQSPTLVYGVDVDVGLGKRGTWALIGELGGAIYFGPSSPDQLIGTLGFAYQANDAIGISVIGLGGFLHGNDRAGVIAGLSTTFGLWKP